jgi:hypothetical protein
MSRRASPGAALRASAVCKHSNNRRAKPDTGPWSAKVLRAHGPRSARTGRGSGRSRGFAAHAPRRLSGCELQASARPASESEPLTWVAFEDAEQRRAGRGFRASTVGSAWRAAGAIVRVSTPAGFFSRRDRCADMTRRWPRSSDHRFSRGLRRKPPSPALHRYECPSTGCGWYAAFSAASSSALSAKSTAAIASSSCPGRLAPALGPPTPGWLSSHA